MNQHGLCVQARHEECAVCNAGREQPCDCGWFAVHLCRISLAATHGAITYADAASVMHADDTALVAGWDLVFDTAVA